jgi:hypothetical protein
LWVAFANPIGILEGSDFVAISTFDMAAKRRKKHKNKTAGLVISMPYNEQKSKY